MTEKRRIKYNIINEKILIKFLYTNFIVLIPFIALYSHLGDRNKSINDFKANKVLTCTLKSLIIDVSKKDDWKIEGYSFIKGKTQIPVTKCEIMHSLVNKIWTFINYYFSDALLKYFRPYFNIKYRHFLYL